MTANHTAQLSYIACDVPEGMRLSEWQRKPRAKARRLRLAPPFAVRPIASLEAGARS